MPSRASRLGAPREKSSAIVVSQVLSFTRSSWTVHYSCAVWLTPWQSRAWDPYRSSSHNIPFSFILPMISTALEQAAVQHCSHHGSQGSYSAPSHHLSHIFLNFHTAGAVCFVCSTLTIKTSAITVSFRRLLFCMCSLTAWISLYGLWGHFNECWIPR